MTVPPQSTGEAPRPAQTSPAPPRHAAAAARPVPQPIAPSPTTPPAAASAPTAPQPVRPSAARVGVEPEASIGQLVSDASTHLSTLIHGELELAKLELKSSVKNAGVGIGLFLGAAVVLVFSLTFGFIALAEGIAALGVSRWLAFLIVFAFLLIVVGLFAFLGIRKVKRVKAPEKTIRTTRETVDYLKKSRA